MKKVLWPISAALLLMVACGGINGLLSVDYPITLKSNWNRNIEIPAGEYQSEIILQKNRSRIALKVEVENNLKKKFYFKFPSEQDIPSGNEDFNLPSNMSGQPYDLQGNIATEEWESETVEDNESCTYEEDVHRCYPDQNGQQNCRWERVTRHGRQDVEYHYEYTKRDLIAELLNTETRDQVASFDGTRTDEYKRYEYQGRCW